jgi:hypothetical protein
MRKILRIRVPPSAAKSCVAAVVPSVKHPLSPAEQDIVQPAAQARSFVPYSRRAEVDFGPGVPPLPWVNGRAR